MSFISVLPKPKFQCLKTIKLKFARRRKSQLVVSRQVVTNQCCGLAVRFYGKDRKTGLAKIVAHLTNSSPSKKRFSNRSIRFPGSNLDSGEITGNVIGSARSEDLTAWARGLSPTSTTRSDTPRRWRARRPLASRVREDKTILIWKSLNVYSSKCR